MEFITQNGQKEVKIVAAPFKVATKLKQEAMKCASKLEDFKVLEPNNLQSLNSEKLIDSLVQLLINFDASEDFEKAVFDCLSYCIYDGFNKISFQLFDDKPEIREDYYEIVSNCIEVNLRPFFKSLATALKIRFQTIKIPESQEQESVQV